MAMLLISGSTMVAMLEITHSLQQEAQGSSEPSLLVYLEIVSVWADRDSTPSNKNDQSDSIRSTIQYLEITGRPVPGCPVQNLSNILIEISNGNQIGMVEFDSQNDWWVNGTRDNLSKSEIREQLKQRASATGYTANALRDPNDAFAPHYENGNWSGGILEYGSLVRLYVNLSAMDIDLGPSGKGEIRITPLRGIGIFESFRVPDTLSNRYLRLE